MSSKKNSAPKDMPATLALADGTIFKGFGFGALKSVENAAKAEVVFNTSMLGYQEILTDPSYAGQMLCFTNPHIGNVGCNPEDDESSKVHAEALIIRDISPVVSNYRAQSSLRRYLSDAGIMGIYGVDTRELVVHLRDKGSQMGALAAGDNINPDDLIDQAKAFDYEATDYVAQVSCEMPYSWKELPWNYDKGGYQSISQDNEWSRPHVVALDCGVKRNILRLLLNSGFRVTVAPCSYTAEQVMALRPDALFLSNGPGDPAKLQYIVKTVRDLIGRFPIFGICLGHQILAQAVGGKTFKLKFGHRGGNHPVRDETTSKVEITVQNHGYAVDPASIPSGVKITHINLNDKTVEGLEIPEHKSFCIQYHPESSPGPHDAQYLFKRFFENVVR